MHGRRSSTPASNPTVRKLFAFERDVSLYAALCDTRLAYVGHAVRSSRRCKRPGRCRRVDTKPPRRSLYQEDWCNRPRCRPRNRALPLRQGHRLRPMPVACVACRHLH
jgi:hypothetical protein